MAEEISAFDEENEVQIESNLVKQTNLGVIFITHDLKESVKPFLSGIYQPQSSEFVHLLSAHCVNSLSTFYLPAEQMAKMLVYTQALLFVDSKELCSDKRLG